MQSLLLALLCFADNGSATHFKAAQRVGEVKASFLGECSGMVASRKQAGVLWVHNDSGADANIHAISSKGEHLSSFKLAGAKAIDWEDIAIGPGPEAGGDYLYVADTGNNNAHSGQPRSSVQIYRIAEPKVSSGKNMMTLNDVTRFDFVYPDGAHDVEALLVDPRDGAAYVFTKRDPRARVYRLNLKDAKGQQVAEFVGELPFTMLVAADANASGTALLLKSYSNVWFWKRNPGDSLMKTLQGACEGVTVYQIEPQGESIAFSASGDGFYTLSEARNNSSTPLYFYAVMP